MELSSLSEEKLITLLQEMNNFDDINNFFMNNFWNKIGIFVKLMRKVSMKLKNWSDFKAQHSIQFREEDWSKFKTLSLNSRPGFRNYRMKLIAWMIREIFKMLSQYAVDLSHVPSQPALLTPSPDPGGMLSRSLGMPSRKNGPPSIWDTHGISGNVFANPPASSSAPYPGGFNPWISNVSEHTSLHVMSESQTPLQDQRCQSGPSARNSVIPSEERFLKELWGRPTTTADFGSPFWQIDHVSNVRLWEDKSQDWGVYLFTISYGSCAVIQRSGDGWFSGWSKVFVFWSTRREDRFTTEQNHPQFSLQKKGHSGGTKKPKRGPFPSWKTDRLLDLWVLPGHWSQRFRRELCRPIYNCSSKWTIFRNSIRNGTKFY